LDKKIYKSNTDKMICGVCGGIANYLGIDPTIVRLLWAITLVVGGTGFLMYFIFAIIMPDEPIEIFERDNAEDKNKTEDNTENKNNQ